MGLEVSLPEQMDLPLSSATVVRKNGNQIDYFPLDFNNYEAQMLPSLMCLLQMNFILPLVLGPKPEIHRLSIQSAFLSVFYWLRGSDY